MKKTKRINRTFWGINLLAVLLFSFSGTHHQDVEIPDMGEATVAAPCSIENRTFMPGEKIVYRLYYNWNFVWIPAGEVVFRVADNGGQYHISADGRTYSSYEWFYKIRDKYDTFLDKETLLPVVSEKELKEGSYTLYDKTVFHQNKGKAVSTRGRTKSDVKTEEYAIDQCVHDMLSIVYYSRNLDFNQMKAGQQFPIKIFMDTETYPLNVRYLGKEEEKKIKGLGKFNTIRFSPQVVAGEIFKDDDQMQIWVTDDANRVPLLIESPISVGSVKAVLQEYDGLKYDMTAKLD